MVPNVVSDNHNRIKCYTSGYRLVVCLCIYPLALPYIRLSPDSAPNTIPTNASPTSRCTKARQCHLACLHRGCAYTATDDGRATIRAGVEPQNPTSGKRVGVEDTADGGSDEIETAWRSRIRLHFYCHVDTPAGKFHRTCQIGETPRRGSGCDFDTLLPDNLLYGSLNGSGIGRRWEKCQSPYR